ncbi:MAG TPA: Gfo/Idh/MocA family oxidoreductase, partial [Jatrophihabitantaceae bacterium]
MSDRLGVVMNGVTGRMGYRQHLVRSVLAIRDEGGVELSDGSRVQLDPVLVGRSEAKVREIAERHGVERWSTDLGAALADQSVQLYFDAQLTSVRAKAVAAAIEAGKHVYVEKPATETVA